MSNYRGSIVTLLFKAIDKNPDMTVGEVIYSILNRKALNKNVVEATDEEIYTSIERFVKSEPEEDETMSEEEFNEWLQTK